MLIGKYFNYVLFAFIIILNRILTGDNEVSDKTGRISNAGGPFKVIGNGHGRNEDEDMEAPINIIRKDLTYDALRENADYMNDFSDVGECFCFRRKTKYTLFFCTLLVIYYFSIRIS